jgi:hypothetical protein
MEGLFGKLVTAALPIIFSRFFFWTCGALVLLVGLPRAWRQKSPFLWRMAMLILAASFFGWPLIYSYLGRYELGAVWIYVAAATFITFQLGFTIALAARRPSTGIGRYLGSSLSGIVEDERLDLSGFDSEFQSRLQQAAERPKVVTEELPSLAGEWRGREPGIEITFSLQQDGALLRGHGTLTTPAASERLKISGTLRSSSEVELSLEEGDSCFGFAGQLDGAQRLSGVLQGVGFPARELTLSNQGHSS